MTLAPPDMDDCTPKLRCTSGANAGLAYTPGNECPDGYSWNESLCDCEETWTTMLYRVLGTLTNLRFCCLATWRPGDQEGCNGCSGGMVPGYPKVRPEVYQEEYIELTRAEWEARYSIGVDDQSECNTFQHYATLVSSKTWRGPGRRWTANGSLTGCGTSSATAPACVVRCDGNLGASYVDGEEDITYYYS